MQIFKYSLKIARKHAISSIIYFCIFMVLALAFSSNSSSNATATFASEQLDITVIDRDHTTLSKSLTNYLGTLHHLVPLEDSTELLQDNLFYRNIEYILVIPAGFESNIKNGTTEQLLENIKVPNSYAGTFVDAQIDQYLKLLIANLFIYDNDTDAVTHTTDTLSLTTSVSVLQGTTETGGQKIDYFFKYLAFLFLCIVLMGLGPIIMVFHSKEVKARMEASSTTLKSRNLQLILGCIIMLLLYWAALIITAALMYWDSFFTVSGALLVTNSLVFLLVALSITFLFAMLVKSNNTLTVIANTLGLGMSFLTGVFIPQELLSSTVLSFAKLLPSYWYVHAGNTIKNYSGTAEQLHSIWTDLGVQLLFAIAMFLIAVVISKLKQEKNA